MAKKKLGTVARLKEIDSSLRNRALRVRARFMYIIQASVAAGLAYWVATEVFGHHGAFFAPIAAVIILGLSGGERIKRAIELSIGCALGVGLGDALVLGMGTGYWQMAVLIGVGLAAASFISPSPLLNNQVAIGSVLIATIMPPGDDAGITRMFDAVIGGAIGILVIALLPTSPLRAGRQSVSNILGIAASVLHDVAEALREGDTKALEAALVAVRRTQGDVDKMTSAASSGAETTKLSPLLWSVRGRVRSLQRILQPVDNSIRNVRVLARRALVLTQDGDSVKKEQIEIIEELSAIALNLSDLYERNREISEAIEIPELVKRLRFLGARVGPEVAEGEVLSAQVILAQSRSIIVDLLQVCGMSRESAVSVLAPTSLHPAYPPELWYEDGS